VNGTAVARPSSDTEAGPAPDVVEMDGVHFCWPGREGFVLGIHRFHVVGAERLLLIGPSGSGKSTLLSLLCGIVTPDAGRIRVLDTDLGTLDAAARDRFRVERFGIIFQMFNLLLYLSVIDNVLLPLSFSKQRRRRSMDGGLSPDREAGRLLERLGLDPMALAARSTARLCVGQQQRVAPDLMPQPPEPVMPEDPEFGEDQAADRSTDPDLGNPRLGGVVQHGMTPAMPGGIDPTDVVTDYNDVQVKIAGYVLPLDFENTTVKEFLLVPYVGACFHVPPPPPNQIIYVTSENGIEVSGMFEPVWATGTLEAASFSSELADVAYMMKLDATEPYEY
jgi:putative ABC transport system ATP-binding protein